MYDGRLVRLRAAEPGDAADLKRFMNDPEVTAHLSARYPLSLADEERWIADVGTLSFRNPGYFAVETLAERRLVGGCGFHFVDAENGSAELGIAIGDRTVWGRGYGTDAMRVLCRVGFDVMNLHRIQLFVFAPNERARRVYERIGFVVEVVSREGHYTRGRYVDEYLMGLLRHEFVRDES